MQTQDIVKTWRQEAVREGIASSLIDAYEVRFGALPEELRAIVEDTHDEATLRAWHRLAVIRGPEEIAATLRAARAS